MLVLGLPSGVQSFKSLPGVASKVQTEWWSLNTEGFLSAVTCPF